VVHFEHYPSEVRAALREALVTRYRMPQIATFDNSAVFALE
jgi:hypothetical protein